MYTHSKYVSMLVYVFMHVNVCTCACTHACTYMYARLYGVRAYTYKCTKIHVHVSDNIRIPKGCLIGSLASNESWNESCFLKHVSYFTRIDIYFEVDVMTHKKGF